MLSRGEPKAHRQISTFEICSSLDAPFLCRKLYKYIKLCSIRIMSMVGRIAIKLFLFVVFIVSSFSFPVSALVYTIDFDAMANETPLNNSEWYYKNDGLYNINLMSSNSGYGELAEDGFYVRRNTYNGLGYINLDALGIQDSENVTNIRIYVSEVPDVGGFTVPTSNSCGSGSNDALVLGWNTLVFTDFTFGTCKHKFELGSTDAIFAFSDSGGGSNGIGVLYLEVTTDALQPTALEFYPDLFVSNESYLYVNSSIDSTSYPGAYVNITVSRNYYCVTLGVCNEDLGLLSTYTHDSDIESRNLSSVLRDVFYVDVLGWVYFNGDYSVNIKNLSFTAGLYYSNGTLVGYNDTIIYTPDGDSIPELPDTEEPVVIPTPNITVYPFPDLNSTDENNSINSSNLSDFYDYTMDSFNEMNESISGVFSFVQLPVRNMRVYVDSINSSINSQNFTVSYSILSIICPCVIESIHWKVKSVITLQLLLMTVLVVLRKK